MKKFFAFFGTVVAVITALIGAVVIFDRFKNKNRIKDGYLKCDVPEADEEE